MNVPLKDCPPGTNTVRGNAKPGEEFAVVNVAFKVTPAFKETIVKKPVLIDAAGKTFNTSVAIIDAGSVPEYTCSFPFRVPDGTKVGSVQIDTATIDSRRLEQEVIRWRSGRHHRLRLHPQPLLSHRRDGGGAC